MAEGRLDQPLNHSGIVIAARIADGETWSGGVLIVGAGRRSGGAVGCRQRRSSNVHSSGKPNGHRSIVEELPLDIAIL